MRSVNPGRQSSPVIGGSRKRSEGYTSIFRSLVPLSISLMARKYIPCLVEPQEGLSMEKEGVMFLECPPRRYSCPLSVDVFVLESYAVSYSVIPSRHLQVSLAASLIRLDRRDGESQFQHSYRQHPGAIALAVPMA